MCVSVCLMFALLWQTDYNAARNGSDGKPLAVFIGSGTEGWNQVCKEGKLSPEVQKVLNGNYAYVYVDTGTREGKSLAAEFQISRVGVVISDHTGKFQAFWHDGKLTNKGLALYLNRYADSERIVKTTDTIPAPLPPYSPPSYPFWYQSPDTRQC